MAGRDRNLKQSSPISSPDKHYPTIKPCQSLEAVTKTKQHPLKCQQQFLQPPEILEVYFNLGARLRVGTVCHCEERFVRRSNPQM